MHFLVRFCTAAVFLAASQAGLAIDKLYDRSIPNEYETVGGHSLGYANAGVASVGGVGAVRMNPAMLAMEPEYTISGGYNWPTQGRDFYQAGVVDSKSSKLAAGFLYSGFADEFGEDNPYLAIQQRETPVNRRASLALAQSMKLFAVGINAQYVNGYKLVRDSELTLGYEKVSGTSVGFGVGALISPQLRFGASVENLANRKISEYAPRIIRTGVAYEFFGGDFTAHFDLRQRERIESLESSEGDTPELQRENELYKKPERMATASFSAKVYDMIRLMGGYGQSFAGPDRKTLGGGIAVVGNNMSLSYTAARPYMKSEVAQQAINLSLAVNL